MAVAGTVAGEAVVVARAAARAVEARAVEARGACHSTWKEAFAPVAVLETARTPSEPTYQKAAPFHDLQPRVRGDMSMRAKPERC